MSALKLLSVAGAILISTGFGTINSGGQNSEHGRITRHALACEAASPPAACFQSDTLDSLAGSRGDFGAVGAPDRGRGMLTSYAHCSAGDYFDIPDYPRSRSEAEDSLSECRDYMLENIRHAVVDAADLLDDDGDIRSSQIPTYISCVYAGQEHGRAKCNVLAHLGRILHASQDFYSHSNWVDQPDPARPGGIENPPGLGNSGRAPWLDLRAANPAFPAGLVSGCFDMASFAGEDTGCLYGDEAAGTHRLRHLDLNKDTGTIDPRIGEGTTARGAISDNFERAVVAAIEDSADKWATFQEMLVAAYGAERAALMVCAITHDDPVDDCV
ncbi:CinY protein [Hyphobacterium sp. CCMP332]|uniref:CinY protein n=1 Tax=Hyphobacterium sp. CCMP332 TaxID=2749086 RepID=UPI001650196A|nr:CinY protein [Hyphobacterium sp. CCMP332]QNL19942.1 CinY protein [Hyphobacterium sp. CCMP332]